MAEDDDGGRCNLPAHTSLSLLSPLPSICVLHTLAAEQKEEMWPQSTLINPYLPASGQACIFSIFKLSFYFFLAFSFCFFCTLLLSTVTPSELNAHWKDNGMSSGLEWPLHLLLLWQHVGKLKREDREEEQSAQESRDKRKGGGGNDAKDVCMCVCSQGQFMLLSSRALIKVRGFKQERLGEVPKPKE